MSTRVLMYGWEFPPHNTGGLGVACHGITQEMCRHDDLDVTLVLPKKMDLEGDVGTVIFSPTSKTLAVRNYNFWLNPYLNEQEYTQYLKQTVERTKYNTLYDAVMGYSTVAEDVIQNTEFDIVHGHDWLTFPASVRTKELSGKPFMAHIHATEVDRTGGRGDKRIYEIEKEGMEKADEVVCVSDYTRNTVMREYGIRPGKVSVIHNGVQPHTQEFDTSNPLYQQLEQFKTAGYQIVLFVGRLTYQKGVEHLLETAHKVLQKNPKTLFLIVGKGDMEKTLIDKASSLKINDRVMFAGWTQGENLRALYTLADVFIMPSVSEPFGLVALEAAQHTTSMILSKNSGVSEVLNHALKVDFWDIDKTTEYLIAVLDYPVLRNALARLSHQEAQIKTWAEPVEKLKRIYHKLMTTV
jgi:glycosyltransferase involved in cell wall biosynthesis